MISNNTFLENLSLRGMRRSLMLASSSLNVLDLHGDANQRERAPDGTADQNVFEIKKGVGITTGLCVPGQPRPAELVYRADVLGSAESKYVLLLRGRSAFDWDVIRPRPDQYRWRATNAALEDEWDQATSLTQLLLVGATGVETGKDAMLVAFSDAELTERLRHLSDPSVSESALASEFSAAAGHGSRILARRSSINIDRDDSQRIVPFVFNPFDTRRLFYRPDLIQVHSEKVASQLLNGANIALIFMRQVVLDAPFSHVFVSRHVINNRCFYSTRGKAYMFPLWIQDGVGGSVPNIEGGALGSHVDGVTTQPRDVLAFAYAQMHSPTYRLRYGNLLRDDYPRVFAPKSRELAAALTFLGNRLLDLHLLEYRPAASSRAVFHGATESVVGKISWSDNNVWLDAGGSRGGGGGARFENVPPSVWTFQFGGYQTCEKWLRDRRGRTLSGDERDHYALLVGAVAETINLMGEIDDAIEEHGGWPGAFQTVSADA